MKATSVQNIKNVKDVCFSIENDPIERESKLTIVASTNDDIFAFEFEGSDLLQSCKKVGLFTGWENDETIKRKNREINELNQKLYQVERNKERLTDRYKDLEKQYKAANEKIKENAAKLKKENEDLKKAYDILDDTLNKSQKNCNEWYEKYIDMKTNVEPFRSLERTLKEKQDLENKYNLEKAANEAQHKFFRQYAGNGVEIEFDYAINDCDEVSYVIVDKKEYQSLMDRYSSTIHGEIENFKDEELSNRRDILKAAEKCVCGQREQDYGTPESNFQLIADLWNDYLKKEKSSVVVDAMDVSMMMALLKIARIKNGGGSGDSFVDLAGYAACGGEIWAGQKHQKDLK